MRAKPTIQLVELDRAECLQLLAATNLGRLAVNAPGGLAPVIRPVNYVFDANSNSVVFRSAGGSKFARIVLSTAVPWWTESRVPDSIGTSSPASSCRDMRPSRLTASSRPARPVGVSSSSALPRRLSALPTCSV